MARKKKSTTKTEYDEQDDQRFIVLMEALLNKKKLTKDDVPKLIKKHYTENNNLTPMAQDQTTPTLRNIVKNKMKNIDPELLDDAFYLIDNVYPRLYTNLNTLDNYFSQDVRTLIFKRFGAGEYYEMAKEQVALPWEVKGALEEAKRKKTLEKNQKPLEIKTDDIIGFIRDNIISEDPFRKAVALLIASGSRPVELFVRSTYTEYEDEFTNGHWVRQTKIAKKKGRDVEVLKPIIYLKAKQFITELEYVREKLKERYGTLSENNDEEKIRSSIRDRANITAKQIFGNAFKDANVEEITLYTARKLYANLSYELYGRNRKTIHGNKIPYSLWLSFVLGHEGKSGSLNNYTHVALEQEFEHHEDLTARQNLLEQKVEQLEERVEVKQIPQVQAKPVPIVSVRDEAINKLKPLFNDYVKKNAHRPSQSLFEKLAKGVLPRATIRNVYKELYREAA